MKRGRDYIAKVNVVNKYLGGIATYKVLPGEDPEEMAKECLTIPGAHWVIYSVFDQHGKPVTFGTFYAKGVVFYGKKANPKNTRRSTRRMES